jgi:Helix-turn-helix domain
MSTSPPHPAQVPVADDGRTQPPPLSRYPPPLMRFIDRLLTRALRDLAAQNGHVPTVASLQEFLNDLRFASETAIARLPVRADQPSWVPVAEAAEIAGCSPQWIRRQAAHGSVRGHKHGRDWLIDRGSAEDAARRRRERERGSGNGPQARDRQAQRRHAG